METLIYMARTEVGLDNKASGVILTLTRYRTFYTALHYIRNNERKSYQQITVWYDTQTLDNFILASPTKVVVTAVFTMNHTR
jgi:hypothetical protein